MCAEALGHVEAADAERGAAAIFAALREDNLEPGGFEHGDGRDADMGLVVADEGVVPEDDAAARGGAFRVALVFREPGVETLQREFR